MLLSESLVTTPMSISHDAPHGKEYYKNYKEGTGYGLDGPGI
jgi:hypothetical protein